MKTLNYILLSLVLVTCSSSKDSTEPQSNCDPYVKEIGMLEERISDLTVRNNMQAEIIKGLPDTVYLYDQDKEDSVKRYLEAQITHQIDSINKSIDSVFKSRQIALKSFWDSVALAKDQGFIQLTDTIWSQLYAKEAEIDAKIAYLDSVKGLKVYDNIIINGEHYKDVMINYAEDGKINSVEYLIKD